MDGVSAVRLSSTCMDSISGRLSSLENLYFPRDLQKVVVDPSGCKAILLDLLARDPVVFLERYGMRLTVEELLEFDGLGGDYEIDWYLNHLKSLKSPTKEELHSRSVVVKNRRLAYMNQLICEGKYFSEDSMREREPYLHHEYVGKFQDPVGRSMARPGEQWSETLPRRAEEMTLQARIRSEQQKFGVPECDWLCMDPLTLSEAEFQDELQQFTQIMKQKFLSGDDRDYLDYSKIDEDETLDDCLSEKKRDEEDKYFEDD